MPSCSILVTNRNSLEAIQLCIESVRKYTDYPEYKIIVYDDNSTSKIDLDYLAEAEKKGWIRLIHGDRSIWPPFQKGKGHPACYWHGCGLNVLVNRVCDTDFAVVMDCDAYVKEKGWLQELIKIASQPGVLGACPKVVPPALCQSGYTMAYYGFWFGILNMATYRDGMEIDWRSSVADRREWPFTEIYAPLYPPEKMDYYKRYCNILRFNRNIAFLDPGSQLWLKVNYYNPKGYKMVILPAEWKGKFEHISHMAVMAIAYPADQIEEHPGYQKKIAKVRQDLAALRAMP